MRSWIIWEFKYQECLFDNFFVRPGRFVKVFQGVFLVRVDEHPRGGGPCFQEPAPEIGFQLRDLLLGDLFRQHRGECLEGRRVLDLVLFRRGRVSDERAEEPEQHEVRVQIVGPGWRLGAVGAEQVEWFQQVGFLRFLPGGQRDGLYS